MKTPSHRHSYIWEDPQWPSFSWDTETLIPHLTRLHQLNGLLNGRMSMVGFNEKSQSKLSILTDDITGSSEIEGIRLSPNSVRSSIAHKLGIEDTGILVEDHYVEGLVEVMFDATNNCQEPITEIRLFGWHAALFPTGYSRMIPITVAAWRKGSEPMQVVSGAMGHERVHYEAPPSDSVESEMSKLIAWCNKADHSPFIMAAVAHLWFVSIHPFDDGNGRIGRTLADMLLSRLDLKSDRYFSMSAEINRNKKSYYEILELTQKGGLDITNWILWFLDCIEKSIKRSLSTIESVLRKSMFWNAFNDIKINERQRKVINRLWDGFEGNLTSSKWAKICKCSQDTALRDINDLIAKGMLQRSDNGGRSAHYLLPAGYSSTGPMPESAM